MAHHSNDYLFVKPNPASRVKRQRHNIDSGLPNDIYDQNGDELELARPIRAIMPVIHIKSRTNASVASRGATASTRSGYRAMRHMDEDETNSEESQYAEEEDGRIEKNKSDEGADDLLDDDDD